MLFRLFLQVYNEVLILFPGSKCAGLADLNQILIGC